MDGVLADFDSMRPNNSDLNHPTEELSPEKRKAKEQFWLDVEQDRDFWANIPVMKNVEQMLNVAKQYSECFVLSKAPSAKHFINGEKYVRFIEDEKQKWILKHLGNFFDKKHIIICNGAKGELIKPTRTDILVDDRHENINEWESHGGSGVLFTNAVDTVKSLALLKSDITTQSE